MLVLILMVVTFCQDCGKPTWASFHAGKSIGSVTFSGCAAPSSTTKSFLILVPEYGSVFHKELVLCHGQAQIVLLPKHFSLPMALRSNSRGHHNDLGALFLELEPKALQQLWRKNSLPSLF